MNLRRFATVTACSLALLAMGAGCASAPTAPPASPSATPASPPTAGDPKGTDKSGTSDLKAPGDAKVGDHSSCPVSGEDFVVTAESPKYEYKGKTYYFCCTGCEGKFAKDPERYLKKKPDA